MKRILIGLLLTLPLLAGCMTVTNPGEVAVAYFKDHNSHHVDSAMKYYAGDVEVSMDGVGTIVGLDPVRRWEEWNAALNSSFTAPRIDVRKDTAFFTLVEGNDWYRALGMGEMQYHPAYMVVRNGKIVEFFGRMNPESFDIYDQRQSEVAGWAAFDMPSALDSVMQGNRIRFGKSEGETWLKIVKAYKAAGPRND